MIRQTARASLMLVPTTAMADHLPRNEVLHPMLVMSSVRILSLFQWERWCSNCMQVHDRMTEQVYLEPLKSFKSQVMPSPVFTVPVLEQGRRALEDINEELGLAFDEQVCQLSLIILQ